MSDLFDQLDSVTKKKIQYLLDKDESFKAVGIVLINSSGERVTIDLGKVTWDIDVDNIN